jgi:hypothetical protein
MSTLVGLAVSGKGDTCSTSSNTPPTPSQGSYQPTGLAIDSSNNLYVADSKHNSVRTLANGASGVTALTTVSGTCGSATSATPTPNGLVLDAGNNLYISIQDTEVLPSVSTYQVLRQAPGASLCVIAGPAASCTAGFRVHAYEPPTITCSANPSTVMPGDPSTITSIASSPQNRPLSYSYSASSGQIASSTATATLATTGASPGTISISCNVIDDLGKQATANTSVTITTPLPPAAPKPINLCSISFERDRKRPVRVDNEAKGCLDEIALTLNRFPKPRPAPNADNLLN